MPRPRTDLASAVDQQIQSLAKQVLDRIETLRGEVARLSDQYERLTGSPPPGARDRRRGASAGSNGKRQRLPGVDVEWIGAHLRAKPMTLKQLQDVAEREGRSSLSVMNVLRVNKNKFKSSEGTKDPGVRGRAAMVWAVK